MHVYAHTYICTYISYLLIARDGFIWFALIAVFLKYKLLFYNSDWIVIVPEPPVCKEISMCVKSRGCIDHTPFPIKAEVSSKRRHSWLKGQQAVAVWAVCSHSPQSRCWEEVQALILVRSSKVPTSLLGNFFGCASPVVQGFPSLSYHLILFYFIIWWSLILPSAWQSGVRGSHPTFRWLLLSSRISTALWDLLGGLKST